MASCRRQFLTPQAWKPSQRGLKRPRKDARWHSHHLVLVTPAMTWSLGESTPEEFEMARGLVAICRPKRRRAGRTACGFPKAIGRLPMRPRVAPAGALRDRLLWLLGDDLLHGGFLPPGCDGSRLECCRDDPSLARMGRAGKAGCSPTLRVTAVAHLTTGVPWSGRLGRGDASERDHRRRLLPTLPGRALVVADAGLDGHDLAVAILDSGASFLIRMSSKAHPFVDRAADPEGFGQAAVSHWPGRARQAERPPLRRRPIRVRGRRRGKDPRRAVDVWPPSDVDAKRMSIALAGSLYRPRWENEGLSGSSKRALKKGHLTGRTARAVHREAYGSLPACQRLLAQGAWALRGARDRASAVEPGSPRQAILAVREELQAAMKADRRASYRDRLARRARAWPADEPQAEASLAATEAS